MRMQDPIASVPGEISTWKSHILSQQLVTVSWGGILGGDRIRKLALEVLLKLLSSKYL